MIFENLKINLPPGTKVERFHDLIIFLHPDYPPQTLNLTTGEFKEVKPGGMVEFNMGKTDYTVPVEIKYF